MAQGQLLDSTWSFEILAQGSKYLLVNENRWDVEKISSRRDNGISSKEAPGLRGVMEWVQVVPYKIESSDPS